MYSLSSLLKVFADQVDKAELRRLTKQALKSGMTLQKLVKPSNFFKGEAFYRQFERCVLEGRAWERRLLVQLSPHPISVDAPALKRFSPDTKGEYPRFELWCRALTEVAKESGLTPEAYLRYAMITLLEVYRSSLPPTTQLSIRADFYRDLTLGCLWFAKNDPFSKEAAEKLLERLGETDDERQETAFLALCALGEAVPDATGDGTDSGAQSEAKEEDDEEDEEAVLSEPSDPSDEKEPARSPAAVEPASRPSRPVTLAAVARRVDPRKIRTKRKEREYVLAATRAAAKKLGRELATKAEKAEKTAKASEALEARERAEAAEVRSFAATTAEVEPEPESASAVTPHEGTIDAPADRPADLFALDPSAATRTVFDLPCAPESGHGSSSATDGAGSTFEPALYERLPKPAYGRARVLAYMRRAGTFMNLFFTHRLDAF